MIWHVVNLDCPLHIIVDTFTFTYNFDYLNLFNFFYLANNYEILLEIKVNPHSPQVTTYNP